MKKLLVILFFAFVFVGCKDKKEDVEADLGARIAGTYQMTKIVIGPISIELPVTGASGSIKLTRLDATKATFNIKANVNGSLTDETGEVTLLESGSKVILTENGIELGSVDGSLLVVQTTDTDGIVSKIEAKK